MTRWDESPELLPPTIIPHRCGCSRQPCRMLGRLTSSRARSAAPSVCFKGCRKKVPGFATCRLGCEVGSSDVSILTLPEILPVGVKLLQLFPACVAPKTPSPNCVSAVVSPEAVEHHYNTFQGRLGCCYHDN